MTNKPMLSVELRALLERVVAHDFAEYCQECGIGQSETWKELRALLDKPVLESQYEGMTQEQAQAVSDDVDEILHGEPAAKHQPAPVADHHQCEECKGWGYHENHHEGGGTECGECGGSGNASVAVFMPDVDELAQIIRKFNGSRTLGAGSLAEAILEEVARLNGLKT